MLAYLDDRVAAARWLTAAEKRVIEANIAREDADKAGRSHVMDAFRSGQVWLLGLIYFTVASGIYIISFWLPTIIKQTGVSDPLDIGLLTAIPSIVAIVAMILVNNHADATRERRWHTVLPCLATAIGLVVAGLSTGNTLLSMIGLCLAAAGASAGQTAFWALPAAFLGGGAAAAGIALVNALGNIAGFAINYLIGWMKDFTGTTSASLYLFAGLIAVGGLLVLAIPSRLVDK